MCSIQNECCQYAIWHIFIGPPIAQNKMVPVFHKGENNEEDT